MRNLLAWIMVLVCAASVNAASLQDYVPKDALLYISWRSPDALGETYRTSTTAKVMGRIEFQQTLDQLLQQAGGMAMMMGGGMSGGMDDMGGGMSGGMGGGMGGGMMGNAMGMMQMAAPFIAALSDAETTIYLTKSNHKDIPMKVGILVRGGAGAQMIRNQMQMMVGMMGQGMADGGIEMIEGDDYFGVLIGGFKFERFTWYGPSKGIAANPQFKKLSQISSSEPMLAAYVDVQNLLEFAVEQRWLDDIQVEGYESLGAGNVQAVGYKAGIIDSDWETVVAVMTTGERQGITRIIEQPIIKDSDLEIVPENAPYFNCLKIDYAATLPRVYEFIGQLDPIAGEDTQQQFVSVKQATGVDVISDVVSQMRSGGIIYVDPKIGFPEDDMTRGIGAAVPLKDASLFAETFERLLPLAEDEYSVVPAESQNPGETIYTLVSPADEFTIGIGHGYLVYSSNQQFVVNAFEHLKNGKASILSNEDYLRTREKFVGIPMWQIGYTNLLQTGPSVFTNYQDNQSMIAQFLPSLGSVARYLQPLGSATWSDNSGLYYRMVSPFPFAHTLGPSSLISETTQNNSFLGKVFGQSFGGGDAGRREMTTDDIWRQ